MAKISSYPSDANVTLSDRLIGSDNENSNETKNFEIGDIVNLAASVIIPQVGTSFVPYTGAVSSVDLGVYNLLAQLVSSSINNISSELNINSGAVVYLDGGLALSNDFGTSGQILTSQGVGSAPVWATPTPTYTNPYLSAYSIVQQNALGANIPTPMQFTTLDSASNVSIVNDGVGRPTQITPVEAGMYNIQFSAQIQRTTGGSSQTVDIWLRTGGTNVANSNTSVNVQANAGYLVASWNFFVYLDPEGANYYAEIMWATTDTAIILAQQAANAVHPATPSIILTVNKIHD